MNEEQRKAIESLPAHVIVDYLKDVLSEGLGMTSSTFVLGMSKEFRHVEPEVFIRWSADEIIRRLAVRRQQKELQSAGG